MRVCPDLENDDPADTDDDGVGDACDLCPGEPDPNQTDVDGELIVEGRVELEGGLQGWVDADGNGIPDVCE